MSGRLLISGFAFLFASIISAQTADHSIAAERLSPKVFTIETIPDPKASPSWNYISNPHNVLSGVAVEEVNSMLRSLEDSTTVQVAVVAINSIGNDDPHDFGVKLFNYWGIGQKNKDNGLLILLVMDQHAIEFITGKGTEGVLTDVACKRIQEDYMVPLARENNFDQCVIAGVSMVVKTLEDPESVSYLYEENTSQGLLKYSGDHYAWLILISIALAIYWSIHFSGLRNRFKNIAKPHIREQSKSYLYSKAILINAVIPIAIIALQFLYEPLPAWQTFLLLYGWIAFTYIEKRLRINQLIAGKYKKADPDQMQLYSALQTSHKGWGTATFFLPVPFLLYSFWNRSRMKSIRNQKRACPYCQTQMIKSSEADDDQYLKPDEQLEEKIHSVDYDIWRCPACENLKKLHFTNDNSKYLDCLKCNARTYFSKGKVTVKGATYSSTGRGVEHFECLNCQYKFDKEYTIAKLVASSSSGGSGGSSGGSSGSGGSSWGGGSSGGGGAGSRW